MKTDEIKYVHIRLQDEHGVMSKGGVTVAVKVNSETEEVLMGIALCGWENYSKATGRYHAARRLTPMGKYVGVTADEAYRVVEREMKDILNIYVDEAVSMGTTSAKDVVHYVNVRMQETKGWQRGKVAERVVADKEFHAARKALKASLPKKPRTKTLYDFMREAQNA